MAYKRFCAEIGKLPAKGGSQPKADQPLTGAISLAEKRINSMILEPSGPGKVEYAGI